MSYKSCPHLKKTALDDWYQSFTNPDHTAASLQDLKKLYWMATKINLLSIITLTKPSYIMAQVIICNKNYNFYNTPKIHNLNIFPRHFRC